MNPKEQNREVSCGLRGWHNRGYLPHCDAGNEYSQSITFRRADSVSNHVVLTWQEELRQRPESERELELYRLIETFLDMGYGACHLRESQVADLVERALLHFDATCYVLHAWIVMPNHVHVLVTPQPAWSLSKIIGSWKSFTSKETNKLIGRSGQFWQEDYFDRYIRNEDHFCDAVTYIEFNPVAAGLRSRPEDWPFSSTRFKPLEERSCQAGMLKKSNESQEG